MTSTAIPIELIRTDGGTQIRACATFQTKVEEYAVAMGEGAQFPPLTVFFDGAEYWLADGFHRLGAYNAVMQALELPGLEIDCEVIEGSQRDAILYACGTNAIHGIPRTTSDKQNAVKTMLENPLVSLNDDGVPWSDRAIGRICKVDNKTVARIRAELAAHLRNSSDGSERAVSRGGSSYTMNTANITKAEAPKKVAEEGRTVASDPPPASQSAAQSVAEQPEAPAKSAVVVEFSSKWDFVYDRLKEIDRAIAALPPPAVAAAEFPATLAHGLTVARVKEILRWWQEFARLWEARERELRRLPDHQHDIEEKLNVTAR